MRRLAVLLILAMAACTSTPSASLQTSSPAASAAARWRVDVSNGPRPVVVSITTDTSAWSWLVQAGEQRTLLDEAAPSAGGIEVMADPETSGACTVLARATFDAASLTIVLTGQATGGEYSLTVRPGASLTGPPRTDYFHGCSG